MLPSTKLKFGHSETNFLLDVDLALMLQPTQLLLKSLQKKLRLFQEHTTQ